MVVAHEKIISKHCDMYPFWKSDLKAFNIEKESYGWSADEHTLQDKNSVVRIQR